MGSFYVLLHNAQNHITWKHRVKRVAASGIKIEAKSEDDKLKFGKKMVMEWQWEITCRQLRVVSALEL